MIEHICEYDNTGSCIYCGNGRKNQFNKKTHNRIDKLFNDVNPD